MSFSAGLIIEMLSELQQQIYFNIFLFSGIKGANGRK